MMYKLSTIVFSLTCLLSCGGGGSDGTSGSGGGGTSQGVTANLAGSTWQTDCSSYDKFASIDDDSPWNVRSRVRIDSSLEATFKTEYFHPEDNICKTVMFDTFHVVKFEVKGRMTTEESIRAYKLNETLVYSSEDNMPEVNYTLVYLDTEKLYFGQPTGTNLGTTSETRHSSISLANYYAQKVN